MIGVKCVRIFVLCMVCSLVFSCSSMAHIAERQVDEIIAEAKPFNDGGNYADAVLHYESALVRYPDEPRLRYNFAIALAQSGDLTRSASVLQRLSAEHESNDLTYLKALGGVAAAGNISDTAVESWMRVVEQDPMDSDTRFRLMRYLIEIESYEAAYELGLAAYRLHVFEPELFEMLEILERQTGRGDGSSWSIILTDQ